MEELRPGVFSLVSVLFKENINFLINQQRLFVNYSFFALFWTSELMSRETFGSDMAQDNKTQGLEYPGYEFWQRRQVNVSVTAKQTGKNISLVRDSLIDI